MYPKSFYQREIRTQKGTCFVLMPFAPRFREVFDSLVDAIEGPDVNFFCTRADNFFGGGHIIEDILRGIGEADIIIADLTSKNPNVFYELGVTHMVKDIQKVLILTQRMKDVPFDVQQLRCIQYEQSATGLRRLKQRVVQAIREVSQPAHRFSIQRSTPFKFAQKFLGNGRCFYSFAIPESDIGSNAAKFKLQVFQHVIGQRPKRITDENHGLECGDSLALPRFAWRLRLDKVDGDTAHFSVIPNDDLA